MASVPEITCCCPSSSCLGFLMYTWLSILPDSQESDTSSALFRLKKEFQSFSSYFWLIPVISLVLYNDLPPCEAGVAEEHEQQPPQARLVRDIVRALRERHTKDPRDKSNVLRGVLKSLKVRLSPVDYHLLSDHKEIRDMTTLSRRLPRRSCLNSESSPVRKSPAAFCRICPDMRSE